MTSIYILSEIFELDTRQMTGINKNTVLKAITDGNLEYVTFKYDGGEKKVLRDVLTHHSGYFRALFDGPLKREDPVIELNVDKKCVEAMIYQFHHNEIPPGCNVSAYIGAYCLYHEWGITHFLEQYEKDDMNWNDPINALGYYLERYPITENLCLSGIKDIRKGIKKGEVKLEIGSASNINFNLEAYVVLIHAICNETMDKESLKELHDKMKELRKGIETEVEEATEKKEKGVEKILDDV